VNWTADCSTVPLVDHNFDMLPLHFAADPSLHDDPSLSALSSVDRQMSLSQRVELIAEYMDVQWMPVSADSDSTGAADSGGLLCPPGELRPRTSSWGGRDGRHETRLQQKQPREEPVMQTPVGSISRDDEMNRKKTKKADTVTRKLGVLSRAVTKKLKPAAAEAAGAGAPREKQDHTQRRRASVTQRTRLSLLTDDMLSDHSHVRTRVHLS